MANKKIERADLVAPDAITSVITELTSMETKLKDLLKTYEQLLKTNPLKSSDDVRKLKDDIEGIAIASKNLESTTKTLNETKKAYNKELAEEVATSKKVEQQLNDINGTLEQNIKLTVKRRQELESLKKQQKDLNNEYNRGRISLNDYVNKSTLLTKEQKELTVANQKLGFTIRAQIKEGQAASTSFEQQAQRLGQLRTAYRKLNKEERENADIGGVLLKSIKALDGQVKANDASIGNFQRNVGNYNDTILESVKGTNVFGFSLGQLATPLGAVTAGATALVALYAKSTAGSYDLITASNILSGSLENVGNRFAKFIGADGKGDGLVSRFTTLLSGAVFGIEATTQGFIEGQIKNIVAELEIADKKAGVISQNRLREIEELKQTRDDTEKSLQDRLAASAKILEVVNSKEDAELLTAQKLLEQYKRLSNARKEDLELQGQVIDQQEVVANLQRRNAQIVTEQKRTDARLRKEQKKAIEDLAKAELEAFNKVQEELKKAESEEEDDDDAAFAAIQRETEILKAKRDIREEDLAENQEYLDKLLEQTEEANQKKLDDEKKTQEDLRKEREKGVDDAIAITNQIGDSLQKVSQKRLKSLDKETAKQAEELSRQERRAEQGLENDLANQEKRAAELARQREEEAKKAERTQKYLAYFAQFQELSKENPNTAAFKAAANVAIAETIAAFAFDGAENIDDKTAHKWRNTGRDDFIIGVHGGERVLTATQNSKIGDISNEDLANIALQYRTGNLGSVVPIMDDRVVSRLESVEKAVKNIHFDIYIDPDSNVTKTEFKNGLKKISTTKRKRLR